MDYKYHVDACEHIGNVDRAITAKYNTFEEAYKYFHMYVDILREERNTDSWEITLFDMESLEVKLYTTSTDFE